MSDKKSLEGDLSEFRHVVNNNLHFMQIQVESLQEVFKSKHIKQMGLKQINKKIFQTSRVINYFLEMQSLLKKRGRCKPVKLEVATDKAIFQLSWALERRGVYVQHRITREQKQNSNLAVKVIPQVLELVIAELLENAVVFGDGLVSIVIQDKGKTISLKISNQGKLSPAELKKALIQFESFGDNAGSGLGLSLVNAFAAAVEGKFWITSSRGKVNVELELRK